MARVYAVPTQDFLQKTLSAGLLTGVTAAASFNDVTGIPNLPGVFIVDRVDTAGNETPNKREVIAFSGTSGTTVVTLTRGLAGTTDQDHAVGAIVEFSPDIIWAQSIYDGLSAVVLPSTGAVDTTKVVDLTSAQALTNKTITDSTNNVMAKSLKSATTTVDVSAATAPTTGQVLTATGGSAATWQTPTSGDYIQYSAVTPTSGTLDAPSFEIVFAGVDLTSVLSLGMKIRLTQSTVKYFFITKIAFSTNTTVTLYGGTDYTLVSTGTTVISAFYYSVARAPFGFPLDPAKWTVTATDTSDRNQTNPTQNTWYNLGSISISIPIGAWFITWAANASFNRTASGDVDQFGTLSTANNSETDTAFTLRLYDSSIAGGTLLSRAKNLSVTTKTSYFLNAKTSQSTNTQINWLGSAVGATVITAVCVYL